MYVPVLQVDETTEVPYMLVAETLTITLYPQTRLKGAC